VYFIRTSFQGPLYRYEQMLLNILCAAGNRPTNMRSIVSSMTKELFSDVTSSLYVAAYRSFTISNYFHEDIRQVHIRYKTTGICLQSLALLISLASFFLLGNQLPGLLAVGLAGYVIGRMVYAAGYRRVPLTELGRQKRLECLEFAAFLGAEAEIGTEGSQGTLFFKYLPYAVVLNVETPWFRRFGSTMFYIPTWFTTVEKELFEPSQFITQVGIITDLISTLFAKVKDPNVD
jgi:hypothetical protein